MIQRAWLWGQKSGNVRTNDVHGEEELRCVLHDTFKHTETRQEEQTREGTIEVEARIENICNKTWNGSWYQTLCQDEDGTLLDSDLPDINAKPEELLPPTGNTLAPNASGIMSFKLGSQNVFTCN